MRWGSPEETEPVWYRGVRAAIPRDITCCVHGAPERIWCPNLAISPFSFFFFFKRVVNRIHLLKGLDSIYRIKCFPWFCANHIALGISYSWDPPQRLFHHLLLSSLGLKKAQRKK